jgi:general secretion pathway protein J
MPSRRKPARAGFTLVEVLVAVAILALVATIAWRGTAAMTDAEARLGAESARWQQLDAFVARLEGDMRLAIPRAVRSGNVREPAWWAVPDDAQGDVALVFTRAGPDAQDEPGVGGQRVGYRLRDGRIEVSYWPQLDRPATVAPLSYALVDEVARLRIWQLTTDGRWSEQWPAAGSPPIPRGVRIEITLRDGSVIERWLALT